MKSSDQKRFEVIHKEGLSLGESVKIIVDKKTGINYMFVSSGYSGGITALLERDGNPVITPYTNGEY
ncbi:MAG: DUF6440 family protein [Oscillospiraceae bacterium]